MANELQLTGSMVYGPDADEPGVEIPLQITDLFASVATLGYVHAKASIPTTGQLIDLGGVSAPGWAVFVNRDGVNFVNLFRNNTDSVPFAHILPGEFAILRLGAGAQAPYAKADTAAVRLEYLIANT